MNKKTLNLVKQLIKTEIPDEDILTFINNYEPNDNYTYNDFYNEQHPLSFKFFPRRKERITLFLEHHRTKHADEKYDEVYNFHWDSCPACNNQIEATLDNWNIWNKHKRAVDKMRHHNVETPDSRSYQEYNRFFCCDMMHPDQEAFDQHNRVVHNGIVQKQYLPNGVLSK